MNEDYRYLELNGERIFAVIHRPESPATHAMVMCHPLGEEKLWSHRVLVSFARDLASSGIAVLRFDFRGEGDSDREFEAADFESRIQDTSRAVDALRELQPTVAHLTLLGLRLGACVAAATAARRNEIDRLLLWDPVTDGEAYMQSFLRLNLMYQMSIHRRVVENRDALVARLANGETINIEGYELAEPLFSQVSSFRLMDTLSSFAGETVIVQINQGDTPIKPELAELARISDRCRVHLAREEPFWKEIKTLYQRAANLTEVTIAALTDGRTRGAQRPY